MSEQTATPTSTQLAATTPPATSESVGTGPNQVIFENPAPVETQPVAAIPDPAAPTEPYQMHELENGQFEVKMESGQVFKGTQQQVMQEMARSVFHGTRTIAELRGKTPPAPPEPTLQPGQIDPTALALADLAAQGLGFENAAALKRVFEPIPQIQQNFEERQRMDIAASFLSNTPDYQNVEANNNKFDEAFQRTGLALSVENMQMVHNHLKATGQYVKVATPQPVQRQPGMPLPPNGMTTTPGTQNPYEMPFEELEAMMRQR